MFSLLPTIVLFVILDLTYVSIVAPKYSFMVSQIQQSPFNLHFTSAILSYIVLTMSLLFVVFPYATLRKSTDNSVLKTAFLSGFLIGFAIYGVFNTTNVALFKGYSIPLAVIDTLWGATLFFAITLVYLSPSVLLILKSGK